MRPGFHSTAVRPYATAASVGILALGLVTAPPVVNVAVPRIEIHAVQLISDIGTLTPQSAVQPAASPTAMDATASDTPDFLAFAASILEYLNSLGLGAGPGLAAIGLSGFVVAFAATAYAWNAFADTVNPGLRFLRIPRVPKFPVCFAGQGSCSSSAAAQTRTVKTARTPAQATNRGVATSSRAASSTAKKATPAKKSPSSAKGSGSSKRPRG